MESNKERLLNYGHLEGGMVKREVVSAAPGLASLSLDELREHEGKCVAIVEGKVVFSSKDASEVLQKLMEIKSHDKVFSSIPKSSVTLAK